MDEPHRATRIYKPLLMVVSLSTLVAFAGCASDELTQVPETGEASQALGCDEGPPAVGLALEIENGAGVPLKVKKGQRFYVNQLDMRAFVNTTVDQGVAALDTTGDFASLGWQGNQLVDQEFVLLSNPDGTFTRRRFYRGAKWMEQDNTFIVRQETATGAPLGPPVVLKAGKDDKRRDSDDFFARRYGAIQWTYDCPTATNCSGAHTFQEEALVELRYTRSPEKTFTMHPAAARLRVVWSQKPNAPYIVPVTQIETPTYAYGFKIDLDALTPPRPDGTYAPGTDIRWRITLRDGQGNRLHPEGSLPTYNEVVFGANEPGIQYYRAFFDPSTTYYRRKHRERMLMSQIIGPAQDIKPVRSIAELAQFVGTEDVQTVATFARDDVYAQFRLFPTSTDLFGGAFDPIHAGWARTPPDNWIYNIPADARPGTYLVTVKGRRTYMGEDVPYSKTVEIQVGTAARTTATLSTGPCTSCHSAGGELSKVLHANDNRAACNACHVPLGFELEGPIAVRTHFIHSRSGRFDAPLNKCSNCHLNAAGIQRTSKAACLSCHKSYPQSHVAQFGPIESMYVGGGRESFDQCTGACHTTHPGSGLN